MKILICVGSTCHLHGSKKVVARFQELVAENHLQAEVELSGKFCMGKCSEGVSVSIDGEIYSVKNEEAEAFFQDKVLPKARTASSKDSFSV